MSSHVPSKDPGMPHVLGSGFADCADEGNEPSGTPDEDKENERPAQRRVSNLCYMPMHVALSSCKLVLPLTAYRGLPSWHRQCTAVSGSDYRARQLLACLQAATV